MARGFTRTFKPMALQRMVLQSNTSTTTTVNKLVSPWLPTSAAGLSVDRVGLGIYYPVIGQINPPSASPPPVNFEVKVSAVFEMKDTQIGT